MLHLSLLTPLPSLFFFHLISSLSSFPLSLPLSFLIFHSFLSSLPSPLFSPSPFPSFSLSLSLFIPLSLHSPLLPSFPSAPFLPLSFLPPSLHPFHSLLLLRSLSSIIPLQKVPNLIHLPFSILKRDMKDINRQ